MSQISFILMYVSPFRSVSHVAFSMLRIISPPSGLAPILDVGTHNCPLLRFIVAMACIGGFSCRFDTRVCLVIYSIQFFRFRMPGFPVFCALSFNLQEASFVCPLCLTSADFMLMVEPVNWHMAGSTMLHPVTKNRWCGGGSSYTDFFWDWVALGFVFLVLSLNPLVPLLGRWVYSFSQYSSGMIVNVLPRDLISRLGFSPIRCFRSSFSLISLRSISKTPGIL